MAPIEMNNNNSPSKLLTSKVFAGSVITPVTSHSFQGNQLVVPIGHGAASNTLFIGHSKSEYNAILLAGYLVAIRDILPTDDIVLNFNQFVSQMERPFTDGKDVVAGFNALSELEKNALYKHADEKVREEAIRSGFLPTEDDDSVVVSTVVKEGALVAHTARAHQTDDVVFSTTGTILPFPLRSTITLPDDRHVRLSGGVEFLWHSCQPNVAIQVEGNTVKGIALRPIVEHEMLTYNYLTTEWDIACPFRCTCGSPSCHGLIQGFKHLSKLQQQALLPFASRAIREKLSDPLPSSSRLANFTHIAHVGPNKLGEVVAQTTVHAGAVLFQVQRYQVRVRELIADEIRIPHSCSPTAVLVEGRLIARSTLMAGDIITVNVSLLLFTVPIPFSCHCGAPNCQGIVSGFDTMHDDEKDAMMNLAEPSVRAEATRNGYVIRSSSPYVSIRANGEMGQATFAAKAIGKGTRFFHTTGLVIPFPTVYTILLAENKHLLFAGGAQCLAHSCDPNIRVVVDPVNSSFDCIALRDIAEGDLISFNYLTTEWDMNTPFPCLCGTATCYHEIRGFAHVGNAARQQLWSQASPAIRALAASQSRGLYARLDRSIFSVTNNQLRSIADIQSGYVICEGVRYDVVEGKLVVEDLTLPHSCDASVVLVEGRLVTCRPLFPGDALTINLSLIHYRLETPFACSCGAYNCQKTVSGFEGLRDDDKDAMMNLAEPSVRAEATRNGYVIRSSSPYVSIRANGEMGQATFAAKAIGKGTRFFHTTGLVIPFPTVYTILLAENKHLLFAGGAQCLAHSCDPNIRVVVDPVNSSFDCIALRDIAEGDLISFNYLTTEWDMNTPFPCLCGTATCFKTIRGFKHLNDAQRQKLWFYATPVIRAQVCDMCDSLWKSMDRSVAMDNTGTLCTLADVPTGKPLAKFQRSRVHGRGILVDDMRLSHSCDPNCFLVSGRLVSTRPILSNEEITVNVSLVEYDLGDRTFDCHCGASSCAKTIGGFRTLTDAEKHRLMIYADPAVRVVATSHGYELATSCELIAIRANGDMGQSTFAAKPIVKGTRFFRSTGLVIPFPTVYTILLAPGKNLLFAGGAHCLAHSCDPNIRVVVDPANSSFDCIALRDIAEGELVSFNYLTTEWDMDVPFPCLCGSSNCYRMIRGFKYLNAVERAALGELPTTAVKELAGTYQPRPLPATLVARDGVLFCTTRIPRAVDLLSCEGMEIFPTHVTFNNVSVRHSNQSNTVYVEGHLISVRDIDVGEPLTVNMCYFVYDMVARFPDSFHEENKGFKYLPEAVKQHDLYLCEPPVRAQAMQDGWIVVSTNSDIVIRQNGDMGQTAYAAKPLPRNTLLFHTAKGLIVPFPTMYTICCGEGTHLLFGDAAECIAHSCDPNVQVVVRPDHTLEFVTVKDVEEGAMLSFCYNTTEWAMNSPFPCLCESAHCARYIHGFKHLSDADRQRLWHLTSSYVKSCVKN